MCVKVGNWEGLAQTKLDRVLSECSLIICLRSFLSIQVFSLLFWKEIDHFVCVYELYKFWQLPNLQSWYFTLNDTHKSTLPVDLDEMAICGWTWVWCCVSWCWRDWQEKNDWILSLEFEMSSSDGWCELVLRLCVYLHAAHPKHSNDWSTSFQVNEYYLTEWK